MIYVDLKGNLGNQLFIYAFARKVQFITKQKIVFSTYYMNKYFPNYVCSLEQFLLNGNCEIVNYKIKGLKNPYNFFDKIINKCFKFFPSLLYKYRHKKFYREQKKGYLVYNLEDYVDVNFSKLKDFDDIFIDGFWQCPKYFDDIREVLLKELVAKNSDWKNNPLFEVVCKTNSTCISIRRGDYVENEKIREKYFVCNKDYFDNCVDKYFKNETLILFSDDIKWVKENIKYSNETFYESGNDNVSAKLMLMSSCKNFILSNSSFSWWCQYLSKNTDKRVLAPYKWYTDDRKCDIFMGNWILVSTGDF